MASPETAGRVGRFRSRLRQLAARPLAGRVWPWIVLGAALVVLAALLGRSMLSGRDATWSRIRETGVWRVGMDPSFPPFEDLDRSTGLPVGLDVDLANAIAARWGVKADIVGVGFDQLVDAVAAHRIDSAVSALPVFDHRARDVSFSAPYVEAGLVIAVPQDSQIGSPEDLANKRVAVEWGSEGDAEARKLQRRLDGQMSLSVHESVTATLTTLQGGGADAAIVDAVSLALFNRGDAKLEALKEPLVSDPYVVVVPVDAPQLLGAVNQALADLAADGTLDGIRARWLTSGLQTSGG